MSIGTSLRSRLPAEIWRDIGQIVMFESRNSANLKNFMVSCKDAHAIGDPILFRRISLAHETNFRNFKHWAVVLIQRKAELIFEIELPDSFQTNIAAGDLEVGRMLLASLRNLKEISIVRTSSWASPFVTYWAPSVFENLPFRLERLVGVFSNPASTKALLATQPHIRSWKAVSYDLPRYIRGCHPSHLDSVCFSITTISDSKIACSMPIDDQALRSHLTKVVIRGHVTLDILDSLSSFTSLRTLSITMPVEPSVTQANLFRRIMTCVPTLVHLTAWTASGRNPATGVCEGFCDMEQVPELPGVQSLVLVIGHGKLPKNLTAIGVKRLMDRCQQLRVLDIAPVIGIGRTYRRSSEGIVYRTQDILCPPSYQDSWF